MPHKIDSRFYQCCFRLLYSDLECVKEGTYIRYFMLRNNCVFSKRRTKKKLKEIYYRYKVANIKIKILLERRSLLSVLKFCLESLVTECIDRVVILSVQGTTDIDLFFSDHS